MLSGQISAGRLALVTMPVVIAGVWCLLAPGWILSREMTWDLLFNLSGAWHLQNGHTAHVDFHHPLGALGFWLTAAGFQIAGVSPLAFLVGELLVLGPLFVLAVLAAARRLPPIPAVLFVAYTVLLILRPANIGDYPNAYSFAMSYNRLGWSALSTLLLIVFVEPRPRRGQPWIDVVSCALILAFTFFLKISYALGGLIAIIVGLVAVRHLRSQRGIWVGLVAAAIALAALPINHPYFADLWHAATQTTQLRGPMDYLQTFLGNRVELALYGSGVMLLIWLARRDPALRQSAIGGVTILVLGPLIQSQNALTMMAADIPIGVVILWLVYDGLCRLPMAARPPRPALLLTAILVLPAAIVSADLATLAGYYRAASRQTDTIRIEITNLRGLEVPTDDHTLADSLRALAHPVFTTTRLMPMRDPLTQLEYVESLLQAGRHLANDPRRPRVLVLDHVNPMPFILGYPPPRASELWLWRERSPRPATRMFADVDVVLLPKSPLDAATLEYGLSVYGGYLAEQFAVREELPGWVVLRRLTR